MQYLEALAILNGDAKSVHSSKGGGTQKVLPCLEGCRGGGGGQKVSDHNFSHFVAPLPRS